MAPGAAMERGQVQAAGRLSQDGVSFEVLAAGDEATLVRPCVDCGLHTGNFCDGVEAPCLAAVRVPEEHWVEGQATPLCSKCDRKHGACHFCRRVPRCCPPSSR